MCVTGFNAPVSLRMESLEKHQIPPTWVVLVMVVGTV